MKKILFLLAMLPVIFTACSSDGNDDNGFSMRNTTSEELESGTATYCNKTGSTTYYLVFDDGFLRYSEYKGGTITSTLRVEYSVENDSIYFIKHPVSEDILGGEKEYYEGYINMVNWGYDKSSATGTGGTQLLIRGDNLPYKMKTGYYDKSSTSLKI